MSTKKHENENHFEKAKENMKNFMGDRETRLHHHKKNIEALGETNKMATEVMRNVAQLQQQYIKQAFEGMSSMMKESAQHGVKKDAWQKHTEHLKEHITRSIDHRTNVAGVIAKSHKDMYEHIKGHVAEHMKDVKKSNDKTKH